MSAFQWVLTGYLLALASLILLGGALGDRFGRRKVFLIGTVWFAVASVLCGAAPNVEVLIAARVLQGVGAALLTPGSLAILQASFREDDRARAVGAWSGLGGVAGAIGPFIGGGSSKVPGGDGRSSSTCPSPRSSWSCAHGAVPETRDPHARPLPRHRRRGTRRGEPRRRHVGAHRGGPARLDRPGVLAAERPRQSASAAFVRRMLHTPDPLVPPTLFRSRAFTVTNLVTVLLYAAIGVPSSSSPTSCRSPPAGRR